MVFTLTIDAAAHSQVTFVLQYEKLILRKRGSCSSSQTVLVSVTASGASNQLIF